MDYQFESNYGCYNIIKSFVLKLLQFLVIFSLRNSYTCLIIIFCSTYLYNFFYEMG